ncbi:Plug domain-containing protein [Marinoscillum pacificum]|uniref:Plug domain-containing protein n=1 Tax=Marinoscillum pacificum TaxID=392723 RepID=UPI002157B408|nr:Plug domain-containing protein [Marinoscillum pacificum]
MMRIVFSISIFFALVSNSLAQGSNIREEVYVHLNSDYLIVGESILFSAYCRGESTGQLSDLSKVLYVELVGEKGAVFQEKIRLDHGVGSGELFLNSLIPTGKYYLFAYTRWMKNFGDYHQSEVVIINPYEDYKVPVDSSKKSFKLDLRPATGKYVSEVENVVGYQLTGGDQQELWKGKVVNANGDKILDFTFDQFGLGKFLFTPSLKESYQVILEDNKGNFHFQDMELSAGGGSTILLEHSRYNLDVQVSSYPDMNEFGRLVITSLDRSMTYYDRSVNLNSQNRIKRDQIDNDEVVVELYSENDELFASRVWYFDVPSVTVSESDVNYPTRTALNLTKNIPEGQYSVSVRKCAEGKSATKSSVILDQSDLSRFSDYVDLSTYFNTKNLDQIDLESLLLVASQEVGSSKIKTTESIHLLPEFREELISGKLFDANKTPLPNQFVALTIPGEVFQLRIAQTDNNGAFTLPFKSQLSEINGYIVALDTSSSNYVVLDDMFMSSYPKLDYKLKALEKDQVADIIARSIRSQIQNTFFVELPESLDSSKWLPQIPFDQSYILDEYTRFKTLKETFVEYILAVNVRENRPYKIRTWTDFNLKSDQKPPLVLLDGVPVPHDQLLEFSPYNIEKIEVLKDRYFLGPYIADGVVSLTTKPGSFKDFDFPDNYEVVKIKELRSTIGEINQNVTNTLNLPDQRDQLYWASDLTVSSEESTEISFTSSDVPGKYEMVIEGFTEEGKPYSIIEFFNVVQPVN